MVERKNNKQKNRTKYFLPGGKKQIQAVRAVLFPYSQLRSKPYA